MIDEEHRVNGELHRPNGPARIWSTGVKAWFLFGKYHRYYGPSSTNGHWRIHNRFIK
jgi:hypothetical protein